jgi:hypothetical protein
MDGAKEAVTTQYIKYDSDFWCSFVLVGALDNIRQYLFIYQIM